MDVRTWSKGFGAVSLVLGPAGLVGGELLGTNEPTASGQLAWAAAHESLALAGNLVGLLTVFVLPATLFLMRLARRGSPLLALIGGSVSAAGWLAGLIGLGSQSVLVEYAARMSDRPAATRLLEQYQGNVLIGTFTVVFVIGHLVGMLVLAVALLRSRAVPRVAALLIGLSPILHAALMSVSAAADALSFGLLLVGTCLSARSLVRVPDDDWDLAADDVAKSSASGRARQAVAA